MKKFLVFCAVLLVAGGAAVGAERAPLRTVLDVQALMHWVIEPAAEQVWRSAGSVVTEAGETNLAPVDEAGWEAVGHAAAVLIESGDLLLLPGRAQPGDEWAEFAVAMGEAGEGLLAAAEARGGDAVFDQGAVLYETCLGCHQRYAIEAATRFYEVE